MNQNKLSWTENPWLIFTMNWEGYPPPATREYNYAMWKERWTNNFWLYFDFQLKIIKMFLHQDLVLSLTLADCLWKWLLYALPWIPKHIWCLSFLFPQYSWIRGFCLFVVLFCCWEEVVPLLLVFHSNQVSDSLDTSGLVWLLTSFTFDS